MRAYTTFFFLCLVQAICFAQTSQPQERRVTLSGTVRDGKSSEALPGLTVQIRGKGIGTTSNAYGFYSLSVPPDADSIVVQYSFVGYNTMSRTLLLNRDQKLDIEMLEEGAQLEAVEITAEKITDAVEQTQMSAQRLTIQQMKKVPVIFGEIDPLKVIQFLPGIKAGTEATAGFYVRGGSSDQNLILLDEAIIYNASHLGGLFSIFNGDAVKGLEVFKGNFPAQYGGRLSSVLDVQLREGNRKKFGVAGGIGLISSRLTFEGPIRKNKGSFILSGRRTYFDLFTEAINAQNRNKPNYNPIPRYYFYDLNLKANYDIGQNDRVFLSGYFGRDVFGFRQPSISFDFTWGNTAGTVRWNHIYNQKFFSNLSLSYSDYEYRISNNITTINFQLYSRIRNLQGKFGFDWYPTPRHGVKFGVQVINHVFTPTGFSFDNSLTTTGSVSFEQRIGGNEGALYIADDWEITDKLRANVGLRLSGFRGSRRDTVAQYGGLEPRVALRYKLAENWALKASYARMMQYIHLATNSTATLPTDVWYPSTHRAPPQYSDQVAIGITRVYPRKGIAITVESYYKWLGNQVELRNGGSFFGNSNLDHEFAFGRGWAYGGELLVEKKEGRLTGWVAYTLSWAWRRFNLEPFAAPEQTFPFRFDRRHDLSVVAMYDISKRAQITAAFVLRTGDPVSVPTGRASIVDLSGIRQFTPGSNANSVFATYYGLYNERGNFRMPMTHRLDLSFTWKFRPKHGESDINIGLYNAYSNRNPFFLYFEPQLAPDGSIVSYQAKILALFPVIPSVTYNFRF